MRFVTAIALAALTIPGLARAEAPAWDGNESYLIGVVAGSMLTGNCDPVKKMMGDDLYLQGHHERCLGVVAFKSSLDAEKKGETEEAAKFKQTFCDHYKNAQDLWQQKPLPTHGNEEDVKRRKGFLDEVISTREKRCPDAKSSGAE
jgi:hypothetical protein